MDASFLNKLHCTKILFFSGGIGKPGIPAGDIHTGMTQQLLETLKAHAGIEHLRGKGMAETVEGIASAGKPCFSQRLDKDCPSRCIPHGGTAVGVEETLFVSISLGQPCP